ncbi:MAG TPA: long-chain fatty acid--CoA ligase [Thermoanaerobaculia bacterium]|nr:long-chain fatty acid--CoA ligase [Thermoanaerobaculia bacterium]
METLADLLLHVRDHSAGRAALLAIKRGKRVEQLSTAEFVSAVHALALALERRGVEKGQRIAVFAENRPEWHVVDFACHLLGVVTVPLYPTLTAAQVGYILRNSGSRWVFFSDAEKGAVVAAQRASLGQPIETVALDEEARGDGLSLVRLQAEGAPDLATRPLESLCCRVDAEDLASLIYTSGTTGEPKGVMLTHRNFVSNVLSCADLYAIDASDIALSFLPLSHVFERTVDYLFFLRGVAIHYAPSIERVPPLLLEVRPTVMTSVPRVYERAYLRVLGTVERESATKRRVFRWALGVGRRAAAARRRGFVGPWLALRRRIAHRLVFRTIHQRFGGRLRFAISGGAALSREVAAFFEAIGLQLYQGYGLTETAPVLAAERPGAVRLGSVGRTVPGVELRIAEDGEILARSPGLMRGYWENPTATAEVIDPEGWFYTGDVGHLDDDGFLFITDRKKDLLVTSGGKNVAPQPIEQLLVSQRFIAQAIVVGDGYPYVTALLVPRLEELPAELEPRDVEEAVADERVRALVEEAVAAVNRSLADHERIRNWRLLARELTIEEGEITPTLKVRRRVVLERHGELISSMYLKTQKLGGGTRGA